MIVFTEEEIKKAYDNSSKIMKSLLLEKWVIENSTLVARKYKLRMDAVGTLNKLISYVMLNLIPMSRLGEYIKKEIKLDESVSLNLLQDIDKSVFQKIKQEVIDYKNNIDKKEKVESVFEDKTKDIKENKSEKEVRDYNDVLDESNEKREKNSIYSENKKTDPYRTIIE